MSSVPTPTGADESGLVVRLTLEQKVRLLTGADSWLLHPESAIGLRPMVLSDGPAGVRGTRFDSQNPSSSLPCPIALGATWDEQLVHDVALALGHEARAMGVDVLLGPTVNIVRTPLSGRGFECYSEDPLLTARIGVAFVRGVQEAGVGATAKHYVANDSETERRTYGITFVELGREMGDASATRRSHVHVRLVGLNLDDVLVRLDVVARLDQEADDRRFGNGFAELRHDDRNVRHTEI